MGYWLHKTFVSNRAFANATSGTEVFDLPKRGIISNLLLRIIARSGSTNFDTYVADALSKVEVIGNGSTVIQSLDGRQIQASAAHDDGMMPPDKEYSPSGGCYGYFDIRFGRFPGDQKYALDCSKWASLELKITYDLAAGATLGSTGFTTSTGYIMVTGFFSPDGVGLNPVGFIRKEEKKVYTTTAAGEDDLALPNDYPYRRLMLITETHAQYPDWSFSHVTVDINNGARKPIDNIDGDALMRLGLAIAGNPQFTHTKRYYTTATSASYHPPVRWLTKYAAQDGWGLAAFDPNEIRGQAAGTGWTHITFWGLMPWDALPIDLEKQSGKDGREAMIDAWGYDEKADIHLKRTSDDGSLAQSIVLEQYATP